jgi:DNA replication and repair protein RecF
MLVRRIEATGFRNLAPLDLELPSAGVVFLGPNGHGKTNLLELLYYPVLFRSLRGARDVDVAVRGGTGFHLSAEVVRDGRPVALSAGFGRVGRRKRLAVDGAPVERLTEILGTWVAVAFVPTDVRLVSEGAAERRAYLDRVLALADRTYLSLLRRYRTALLQRNAGLRAGQWRAAAAFDSILASAGARLIRRRLEWVGETAARFGAECCALGEAREVTLSYTGDAELAHEDAWAAALVQARPRDEASGTTSVGPHRHDLDLRLEGVPLRDAGSTGQQRTAAVALKLCEHETLRQALGMAPALLLDDVFAELDRERQERLAARLHVGSGQIFVTAPRTDELPPGFELPIWRIEAGTVTAMEDQPAR